MKLKAKILLSTLILMTAALGISFSVMIISSRNVLLDQIVPIMAEQEEQLYDSFTYALPDMSSMSDIKMQETTLQYYFKNQAVSSGSRSEYVLQTKYGDIYNNSGFDAYGILTAKNVKKYDLYNSSDTFYYCFIRYDKREYCVLGKSIFLPIQRDCYLSIVRDITEDFSSLRILTGICVSVSAACIFFTLIFLIFLLRWFLRPIHELQKGASYISEKNYKNRIPVKSKDEIGELTQAFNQMAEAVEQHVISIRKVSEEQKMLLAALAHEMRTPVTAITGYSHILRYGKLSPEQTEEAIIFIDEESRRLERLSTKLSQLISMEQQISLHPVNTENLFFSLEKILVPLAEKSFLELHLVEDRSVIMGDEDLLICLISNLFDNARKAGSSCIYILLENGILRIIDDGKGMEKEELDKIMQPFYKIDRSRNREGFGLGLALCHRIAEIHGSDVKISSKPGEGSVFTFHLQLLDDFKTEDSL